jgi:cysteine desulfurase family protein (TIGR01976 family)
LVAQVRGPSLAAKDFDVARVRGLYPTLGLGTAYLDGPLSALQPESVIRAIIAALRSAPAQPGANSARSQRTAKAVQSARRAFADLVGGTPESVVFGTSLASVQLQFSEVVAADFKLGDEIVLSRADSDSLVMPWLRAARTAGVGVRWAEVDLDTGELPTWQYDDLISPRTRLVTVPLANPVTGTVPDVRAIAALAHRHDALVLVDVGAAAPHRPIDLVALDADLVAVSAPAFGGPTVAALVARPGLLLELDGRLRSAAPHHFELTPLPVDLLDGATAAIDHLADLDESAYGRRRDRLVASVTTAGAYTEMLWRRLDDGLRALPGVTVLGPGRERVPVVAFSVAGRRPGQVAEHLARRGVSVWSGPSGQSELLTAFGADELGGAVFAGLMPHTTPSEVDQLLDGLAALAASGA